MIITGETVFTADGCKCFLVIICDETGKHLEDVVAANTTTGEYKKLLRGDNGHPIMDDKGYALTTSHKAEQFFFTVATPCRCDNPATRECGPICSGAAKE